MTRMSGGGDASCPLLPTLLAAVVSGGGGGVVDDCVVRVSHDPGVSSEAPPLPLGLDAAILDAERAVRATIRLPPEARRASVAGVEHCKVRPTAHPRRCYVAERAACDLIDEGRPVSIDWLLWCDVTESAVDATRGLGASSCPMTSFTC